MIDSIQNKYHREIIKKLIIQNPSKESFFLDEYTKLKKYKALIKNKNIKFDSFFEKEISFKSFEDFSDKISNEIILNNAKKMKRSILNNKYKHLENERTNKLFLTLAENNIKKEAIKDFIGKKIITYINKSPEEFNNALSDVVETLISWDINKYKKNKILNKSDILEESEQTLLVDMNTTEKVNQYGSDMWCIKRDENYYQEYKSEGLRFFNFLDFNKNADDKKSQIAFAVNFQGDIIDAYFKNDDNAMSYVKKELPNYKFKSMNIEEIIDYLDETNTINKETFVKKFIEQSNELIIDNIYIDIEDMPTEDYTIDQLFEYGYDTWEYEGFGRDNIIKLTSFINTENNNSNEIIDMLFKNNMPEKDEFFTNCIYKKLRNDKSFNGKELIKLAEEYSEKSSIDLSEILFNVEFFALESEFKREILSELKTQNKCGNEFETRDILNNSPLEDTEIIIDYLSNNPLWSINKQDYINNILKTEDREKVKGLNHLINSNEINSLKPEVIIKALKIADNIYENEINKSIKEKIISKIKRK